MTDSATPQRIDWSDDVCTALQLLEHCQDVREDRRAGRVYLPAVDMTRFGVTPEQLDASRTTTGLRGLISSEVARARFRRRGTGDRRRSAPGQLRRARPLVHTAPARPCPSRGDTAGDPAVTSTLEQAYVACEDITRTQARNFHYGIRLLPPGKRAALSAVYAVARRIDDIGDGTMPLADKRAALLGVSEQLHDLDRADDPVFVALSDVARRLPIPLDAFDELIDGVEMDLRGATYPDFDALVHYCRCVAGSIGRLCLGVFGARDFSIAPAYADALGIALQQTNILRDIREDFTTGRVYLPQADLDHFGVDLRLDEHGELIDDGSLTALVHAFAARNRAWYDDGLRLVPLLDRRSAACAAAMSGIYRRLLDTIDADPALIRDRRLSLSGRAKATVALRAITGFGS